METIAISCPECKRPIKAPAGAVGKKMRCKGCEHVFIIQAPATAGGVTAKPAAQPTKAGKPGVKPGKPPAPEKSVKPAKPEKPAALTGDEEEDPNPYGVTHMDETPRCPQCAAEMASADAVICIHCGFNTRTREQVRTRKVRHATGGDKFMWLLPGILSAVAVLLLIGYCFFHHFALPNILEEKWDEYMEKHSSRIEVLKKEENIEMWKAALIHPAIEVWIIIPILFASYKLGRFAVNRLVYHREPPEVEKK